MGGNALFPRGRCSHQRGIGGAIALAGICAKLWIVSGLSRSGYVPDHTLLRAVMTRLKPTIEELPALSETRPHLPARYRPWQMWPFCILDKSHGIVVYRP